MSMIEGFLGSFQMKYSGCALSLLKNRMISSNPISPSIILILLYSEDDDPDLKIRLKRDESNYFEAGINHVGGSWKRYEISISSMTKVGSPSLSQINYLEIETDLMSINIDSDYMFVPATREQLKLKFTLTRPSPDLESPRVKLAKFVWREGG